jgi:ArsR family transcriptional regulator
MQVELPVRHRGECCDLTVELDPEAAGQIVEVLKALADRTRLQIVAILMRAQQPVCVCDLTAVSDLAQPTISHHMGRPV